MKKAARESAARVEKEEAKVIKVSTLLSRKLFTEFMDADGIESAKRKIRI